MGDSLRMSIVLPIIESLKNAKSYHKAIDLINKEVHKMENVDNVCSLLELLAHCYCGTFNDTDYDKAFEALCRCRSLQGDDYEFQNAESYFIFGAGKFKRGMLDDALVACTIGLNKPQIEPELKHALECSITKITKEIEAEKLARDEAKKLIEAEEREKKKAEDTQNKMRQKKEKMKNVENVTKVMEENLKEALKSISDMEIREDGGTSTILPEWQPREFNVPFNGILEKKSGRNCFIGSIQSELCKLPKSFVEASSYHFDKCDELVTLCSNYECLLNVEHLILNPIDMSEKLLVTEIVYSIEEFFSLKYQKLKSSNIFADETSLGEMWWDHISGMFWRIFRDVARGLMFLHEKTNYACGDLSFNTFVTFGGRGRILPSLDKSKKGEEDVTQFVQLLNNIVYFPFVGKSTPVIVLPSDLSRLLDFIPRMQRVPTYFLVNHPFFWTVQEKIDFALKLKKFIKKTKHTEAVVQKQMRRLGAFKNWWNGLAGVYFKIWNTAQLKKTITSYKREVDIVRFFNAAYSHVNDGDYKIDRKWKKLTDVEIERNLEAYFPDYCVTIFGCLCVCMNNRSLRENELKDVNHLLPS